MIGIDDEVDEDDKCDVVGMVGIDGIENVSNIGEENSTTNNPTNNNSNHTSENESIVDHKISSNVVIDQKPIPAEVRVNNQTRLSIKSEEIHMPSPRGSIKNTEQQQQLLQQQLQYQQQIQQQLQHQRNSLSMFIY